MGLDSETIKALLAKDKATTGGGERKYPVREQHGPLRRIGTELRCASRGCNSPTYYKVQGIQYCMTHCLVKLNEMLIELGVER